VSSSNFNKEFGREIKDFFFIVKIFARLSSFSVLLQKHCSLHCQSSPTSVKNFRRILG